MKIQQSKKQFLIFYMSGFLAGILYANMVSDSYLESYGVFSEYFLRQFQIQRLSRRIFGISSSYSDNPGRSSSGGRLYKMETDGGGGDASLDRPRKRHCVDVRNSSAWSYWIVICAVGVFPQIFFYLPAALVYLWYLYLSPQVRWNSGKSIFTGLMFLAGIALEAYVNPVCLKAAIRLFVK